MKFTAVIPAAAIFSSAAACFSMVRISFSVSTEIVRPSAMVRGALMGVRGVIAAPVFNPAFAPVFAPVFLPAAFVFVLLFLPAVFVFAPVFLPVTLLFLLPALLFFALIFFPAVFAADFFPLSAFASPSFSAAVFFSFAAAILFSSL